MSNYIMVPVPEERVTDVYALLAQAPESDSTPVDEMLSADWSEAEIKRCYEESSDTMKRVLRLLAEKPGKRIPSDELYTEIDHSAHQFAGVMGAFGRRVKNRYSKSDWFFDYQWDSDAGNVVYTMTHKVAVIIVAIT